MVPTAGLLAILGLTVPGAARPDDPRPAGNAELREPGMHEHPAWTPSCERYKTRRRAGPAAHLTYDDLPSNS